MVAGGRHCSTRSTITLTETCSANLYRRIKRRVGRSLKRTHSKGNLVPSRKSITHKLSGTKGSLSGSKTVPGPLCEQNSAYSHIQHHSGCQYKQGLGDEVGPLMCPSMENPGLVYQETGNSQGSTHLQPVEHDSRQTIQTRANHSDRMVPPSRGLQSNMIQVAPTPSGPVCHQVQQQVASLCLTGPRPLSLGSGCPRSVLGGSGPICLPTSSHLGQSGGEVAGLPMQQSHSDCTGVAYHPLVQGSSGHVQSNPTVSAHLARLTDSTIQPDLSQESGEPESACLAPRASAIKEQGFSEAVAERIETAQRGSTRSVYEAKWTIFTNWCHCNQVDFRAPPIKSIADFLLYLFQDRKLQPSTINGYRSAIADKLGNSSVNVSKDENLTYLLDSFHRGRPKGRRGMPSCNLSLVLHQLTKAPFEPLKDAYLRHLTFKTVFLLALGSGKRKSEIHAWLHKNWSLYPSPSFLSKNQLAKEGPDSVAPVVIPALAPTLEKSLKGDRSLCQSEPCVITWTGPQISGRIRSWSLSPSRKALTRTSPLPPSPHGSSRL